MIFSSPPPRAQDASGRTALHVAVGTEHGECVRLLLQSRALDCSLCDRDGRSAFFVALAGQKVHYGQALLARAPSLAAQVSQLIGGCSFAFCGARARVSIVNLFAYVVCVCVCRWTHPAERSCTRRWRSTIATLSSSSSRPTSI